jgi:hypothetical protein
MLKSSDEVGKELLMFYKILYVLYLSRWPDNHSR